LLHRKDDFMTSHTHLIALIVACTTTLAGAQGPSSETTTPSQGLKVPEKSLRLVGCVQPTQTSDKRLALSDQKRGIAYLLSGKDASAYIGKRVRVVGGLLPSPNIAAQAGAIDPTIASTDRPRAGTGNFRFEELFVKSVQPRTGSCP
jgi:hypothetical protein